MTATPGTQPVIRSGAPRLVLFNHKGGVGKTTLTIDIAAGFARHGKKVLVVDADPQCNLTAHLISEDVVDDLLDRSDTPDGQTLWSAVKPIVEASGGPNLIAPFERLNNLFILPGDIRLSEFEAELNDCWAQCYERKTKGFRGTSALSVLVTAVADKLRADVVFYDVGPNIGPLNRVVLLDSDYFLVPVACDLFSVRALQTLGRTLVSWIKQWATIAELAPSGTYLLPGAPKFIGYLPQRFKVYGGQLTRDHSAFLAQIERRVQSDIIGVLREVDDRLARSSGAHFMLGQVKDFGAAVQASQREGVPLAEKSAEARAAFDEIVQKILERATTEAGPK